MNLYKIMEVHAVYCVLVQEIWISIGASVCNIVVLQCEAMQKYKKLG